MLRTFFNTIDRWWFSPMPDTRLSVVRWLVGTFTLWYCSRRLNVYYDVARGDLTTFEPIGVLAWLPAPISPVLFDATVWLMLALALAFTVGWKFRLTGPCLAVAMLFVITYRNSWSMIYHTDNAVWFHVLILSLTPAADHWSVDAWLKSKRHNQLRSTAASVSPAYGWPIRLLAMGTGAAYFLAGVAKVNSELGWSWALGDALRKQVAVDALRKDLFESAPPEMAFWLYDNIWLFTVMGVGTFVLELGAPIFLINRFIGKLWAIQTWCMHIGIFLIMGITFEYCLTACIFVFAFDVEKPIERLLATFSTKRKKSS